MKKFSEEALRLLAKYGLGCLPEEKRKCLESELNACSEDTVKDLLPLAYSWLGRKEKVDEKDIRRYFLGVHNFLAEKTGNKKCLAYVAKVVKTYGKECEVVYKGRIEKLKCLEEFKEGDEVVVHMGYAVEKYDKNLYVR